MDEQAKIDDDMAAPRPGRRRSVLSHTLLALAGIVLFTGFTALGIWQMERRSWKLTLISAVDARVAAAPVEAPPPEGWLALTLDGDEYRHVLASGRYESGKSVFVQATTDYGGGFWLMTPLRDQRGFTVLVNRGFVASQNFPADAGLVTAETTVTGLLRVSQPGGGFLRSNDPEAGRWYSRDVAAIAKAVDLDGPIAPYFIDAGSPLERRAEPMAEMGTPIVQPEDYPIEGLTQIAFRNQHLQYALTWFALAILTLVAGAIVIRHERRQKI